MGSQNLMQSLEFSNEYDAVTQIRQMDMTMNATRFIAFPDKSPVIPLLDALEAHATDTVDQFAPEF